MALDSFYRIMPSVDGRVDVYLTPGEVVPAFNNLNGRMDYVVRLLAVMGVDPADPTFRGDLEEHIRRHYSWWLASAEEVIV